MNAKLLIAVVVAINCYTSCGAALRRTPKVYNALITTDENLTSSRAYPVIQPTIHEPGVAHFPFGPYNPYGFYSPPLVRFGQAIAPGLHPREQLPYPLPYSQQYPLPGAPQQENPQELPYPGFPFAQNPAEATPAPAAPRDQPNEQQPDPTIPDQDQKVPNYMPLTQSPQPQTMAMSQNQQPQAMPNEKLPIPLNEFGLPPALVPLPQYHPNQHGSSVSLPTYGYHQYPVIYDPIIEYREQYLPPYDYFPSHNYAYGPAVSPNKFGTPPTQAPPVVPATAPSTLSPRAEDEETSPAADASDTVTPDSVTDVPNIESIKNVSKNKNHAVPDVPPPPIPSGAKAKKQH